MKIVPNQTFKHGRETYEEGEEYEVSEEDAEYFAAAGWVGERHATEAAASLNVHDITLGHESRIN